MSTLIAFLLKDDNQTLFFATDHDVPYFRNLVTTETDQLNGAADEWDAVLRETPSLTEEGELFTLRISCEGVSTIKIFDGHFKSKGARRRHNFLLTIPSDSIRHNRGKIV